MSKWDERLTSKDDFNKAAQPKKDEPDKPSDPELKPKPPSAPTPGFGGAGGGGSAWDRHHTQASNKDTTKNTPQRGRPEPTKDFNKSAKGK